MRSDQQWNQVTSGHMSDADRLADCLCSSREISMRHAEAACESTNNGMRELFLAFHSEETHNQEILFNFLHTRGSYPVEMASPERIGAVKARFQQIHNQLGLTDKPSVRTYHTADPKFPPASVTRPNTGEHKEQN